MSRVRGDATESASADSGRTQPTLRTRQAIVDRAVQCKSAIRLTPVRKPRIGLNGPTSSSDAALAPCTPRIDPTFEGATCQVLQVVARTKPVLAWRCTRVPIERCLDRASSTETATEGPPRRIDSPDGSRVAALLSQVARAICSETARYRVSLCCEPAAADAGMLCPLITCRCAGSNTAACAFAAA